MQLIQPPSPFMSPEAVIGMASYSVRAIMQGQGSDVWEMLRESS